MCSSLSTRSCRGVVDLARDPATHAFVTGKLEAGLARTSDRTWGQLLEGIPPGRMGEWLVRAVRSELAGTIYREGSRRWPPPPWRVRSGVPRGSSPAVRQSRSNAPQASLSGNGFRGRSRTWSGSWTWPAASRRR